MPKLNIDNLEDYKIPGAGSFQFSAVRPENLGATEYTLVTLVVDVSGSVSAFSSELLKCIKTIVEACKKSPRSENLLFRLITFSWNNSIKEVHGFKLLSMINPDNDYQSLKCDGNTALFDATYEAISATLSYSKNLMDQDFNVNGAIYIITDGENNDSRIATENMIKNKLFEATKKEPLVIESLLTILIGVNASYCAPALQNFKDKSELTQFVDVGDATAQRLAKLANFVSKSVSSQSQALGTGASSQPLTF